MVKIEIDIPDEIGFMVDKIKPIEWSYIATKLLQERLDEVVSYNNILSKSKATEKDAEEIAEEIKKAVWENYSKHL